MTEFDDQDDTRTALDPRKLVEALRDLYDAATPSAYEGRIDVEAYVYAGRTLRDAEAALKDGQS